MMENRRIILFALNTEVERLFRQLNDYRLLPYADAQINKEELKLLKKIEEIYSAIFAIMKKDDFPASRIKVMVGIRDLIRILKDLTADRRP